MIFFIAFLGVGGAGKTVTLIRSSRNGIVLTAYRSYNVIPVNANKSIRACK
jgi:hypothetical protein